ncbi:LptF/LptG family permease [Phenylobacterium immobile]|uniref:LptF/LptG family permease n=1 Tax=Phenylobacterium immobile TaxID=21 RepID=UPI000A9E84DE|nr:LptF/LptG family permease [Phenylobacterium immobile]
MNLQRYVLKTMATRILVAALVLIGIMQILDLLDVTNDIIDRGLGFGGMIRYASLRMPRLIEQAAPLSVLAGAIFAFMKLAGDSEIVAMRASGLSAYRLLRMVAPAALAVMVIDFAAVELVAPRTDAALQTWWRSTAPPAEAVKAQTKSFRIGGDVVIATTTDVTGKTLTDVKIYRRDPQGRLIERIEAPSAVHQVDHWRLNDPHFVRFENGEPRSGEATQMEWASRFRPTDAQALFFGDQDISAGAARRALDGGSAERPPSFYATRIQRAIAGPFGVLVMLALALPVALASFRASQGAVFVSLSLASGLLFLVFDGVFTAMGESGAIAPFLGAWSAAAIFGSLAAAAIVRLEG